MNQLADAVRVTLGPKGRNVVLEKKWGAPTITNDGVSIAKEIELEDPYERIGAELVKEVAKKTDDVAGDGTTTATVLAWAMVREGLRNVAAGANPMSLKRGIEAAVEAAVGIPQGHLQGDRDQGADRPGGSISAADTEIGDLISEAIDKVGKDGVITVEESQTFGMDLELVEGMRFDKGYIAPYFATDTERMEASPRRPLHPLRRLQDLRRARPAAPAGEGHAVRPPAGHHRRGRRGRGPGHAGRQQDPGHVQERGHQGPGLRRAPQGHAPGHGHPDRRPGRHRGGRPQAGERHPGPAGPGPQGRRDQGRDHHRRGRRRRSPTSRAASARSRPRSRTPTRTTTGRSCRSAWPSCPAASRSSRSARPPRWSSRRRSTASRTPSPPPRPPSRRAWSPAAASPCCGPRAAILDRAEKLEGDEATGARIVARAVEEPLKQIAVNAGLEGGVVVERVRNLKARPRASTPPPASTRTCSRPASSTPPRSPARPCRTRRRSRPCSSPPRPSSSTSPRRTRRPCPVAAWRTSSPRGGPLRLGKTIWRRHPGRVPSAASGTRVPSPRRALGHRLDSIVYERAAGPVDRVGGPPPVLQAPTRARTAKRSWRPSRPGEGGDHQVVTFSVFGHKADLGVMALGPDWVRLRRLQAELQAAGLEIAVLLRLADRAVRVFQGLPEEHLQARLYPQLPPEGKRAICFYPMSKRRGSATTTGMPWTSRSASGS